MVRMILDEDFGGEHPDERLHWRYPPGRWLMSDSRLVVWPEAGTDFWQRTHYGFCADNGHFLGMPLDGDFTVSAKVQLFPLHQYDQAGLMVRCSAECWIKTSVEYEPEGPCRLGAVVTKGGFSDWSTQDFPPDRNHLELRVRRVGNDFTIDYLEPGTLGTNVHSSVWTQMRLTHLENPGGQPPEVGLYACSPKEAGLRAEFGYLRIETG